MNFIVSEIFPASLYNFLKFMNESSNEKTILDCGAGGRFPKLALFYYHGYKTYGIEISEERINWADEYSQNKNITLNIKKGDM